MPALLICAALTFAAWAYGATEPWAWRFTQLIVGMAALGSLAELSRDRWLSPNSRPWLSRAVAMTLVLLCGFIVLQGWNASHSFSSADEGLSPLKHIAFLPRSVDGARTFESLWTLLTYAAAVGVIRCMVRSRIQHHILIGCLLLSGFSMGLLVILQRLDHPHPPYPMTGMFVNANSYAAYANLLFPMALVTGRSAHLRALLRAQRSHPGYLLYLVAAVIAVSIVASGSRAGTAICAASLFGWLTFETFQAFRGKVRGGKFASALIPLIAAAGLLWSLGDARFQTEFESLSGLTSGLEGRRNLLLASVDMFRDRWIGGSGAGTFACGFPYYQPPALSGLYFKYAHNEWLEYAIELGVIGCAFLGAFLVALMTPAWKEWRTISRTRRPLTRRYELIGIALGLGAVCVHALADFPLHIPGVALVGCAWVGLAGQRIDKQW